jgi:hypothetical protein
VGQSGDGRRVAGQVRLGGFGQVRAGAEGGRGPKPTIPQEKIDEIVELTMNSTPDGETHWSCRSMAERVGVSKDTVQRVWSARGLRPRLVETFTVSNDPPFEEQLVDVVGLYLDPPDNAGVPCMDESPLRAGAGSHPAVAADGARPGADDDE